VAQFDLPLSELHSYHPDRGEPADFDAFWSATLSDAAAHELKPEFVPYDALLPGVQVHDVRFGGYGGQRVAGWLLTPAAVAGPRPCIVQFIGYGGGRGRPHEWLLCAVHRLRRRPGAAARVAAVARGRVRGARGGLPRPGRR
jgi:cephalosporin-C deacetylase